jgi:hypothetical protein
MGSIPSFRIVQLSSSGTQKASRWLDKIALDRIVSWIIHENELWWTNKPTGDEERNEALSAVGLRSLDTVLCSISKSTRDWVSWGSRLEQVLSIPLHVGRGDEMARSYGGDPKIQGPVLQQVYHDKDPNLYQDLEIIVPLIIIIETFHLSIIYNKAFVCSSFNSIISSYFAISSQILWPTVCFFFEVKVKIIHVIKRNSPMYKDVAKTHYCVLIPTIKRIEVVKFFVCV